MKTLPDYVIALDDKNIVVTDEASLVDVPLPKLVEHYNLVSAVKVKRFKDRATAMTRLVKAVAERTSDAEPAPVADAEVPAKAPKVAKAPKSDVVVINLPQKDEVKNHRPGSKRARTIDMLKTGATFQAVSAAIGWDKKTTYEGIRLLHIQLGYGIKTDAVTGVITLQGEPTIAAPVAEPAAPDAPEAEGAAPAPDDHLA